MREKRGLLQKAVAADLNIGNTTLSNYEKSVSSPNPDMLVAFADYFGTSVDYLLGRTDDPSQDGYSFTGSDRKLLYAFNSLDESSKKSLLDYASYLAARTERRGRPDGTTRKQ